MRISDWSSDVCSSDLLFQAFSQADTSTTRLYGGTGLGLAISKRIVELMSGRIGVGSEPGRGATFWFEAPLLKVQGDMPATPHSANSGRRLPPPRAHPPLAPRPSLLLPTAGLRVRPPTRLYGGTGLGLGISKRIVELMSGRIGVGSEPGRGATFWFEAPLLKVQGDMPATAISANSGGRLLLLSADPRLRLRLSMLLPNWGLRVSSVETTQEALDRVRTAANQGKPWAYSVVLADLPGIRNTAVALHRNISRSTIYGDLRLVCLYGEDPVPDELQRKVTLLSRQAPDADLRAALTNARPATTTPDSLQREAAATPTTTMVTSSDNATTLRSARVLLVEDNPVNLMVGQRLLGVLGITCDTASNGEAALTQMTASRYDLVLMDCQMPVMDGYTATRRWREREALAADGRHLPIVAMTANAMAGDRQKCLDAGMDDYLPKPVTSSAPQPRDR